MVKKALLFDKGSLLQFGRAMMVKKFINFVNQLIIIFVKTAVLKYNSSHFIN